MKFRLSELIDLFGGVLVGEDIVVDNLAPTDMANSTSITFLSDAKYKSHIKDGSGAIILKDRMAIVGINIPCIETDNPYYYFTLVNRLFNPAVRLDSVISDKATIDDSSSIANGAAISVNVVIGRNCKIGQNSQIYPNVTIGNNVTIAENTIVYPNVSIYDRVSIGSDCILHSGCVIGSDGFGNAQSSDKRWLKIPQVGGVEIGNDVEIGANTTIDSGTLSPTIIRDGVRIDNLVQIAHNVYIDEHSAIAACVGIAGGSKIGKYCQIAGGAGITGHISIADHTVISGASNVSKDITEPGLYACGLTAMPYKNWARVVVGLRNLENTNKRIKELEETLKLMKERV